MPNSHDNIPSILSKNLCVLRGQEGEVPGAAAYPTQHRRCSGVGVACSLLPAHRSRLTEQ